MERSLQLSAQVRATAHWEVDKASGWGVVRNIPRWLRQWQKCNLRRLGSTLQGYRIFLRNILQRDIFWNSVNNLLGSRERGCLSGGEIRKAWT